MDSVNAEMARVLKHELAHSFINQVSHARCPQWLHEGIAQLIEPKSLGSNGRPLARLFAAEREINGLSCERRLAFRREHIASLVTALEDWMRAERVKLSRHAEMRSRSENASVEN